MNTAAELEKQDGEENLGWNLGAELARHHLTKEGDSDFQRQPCPSLPLEDFLLFQSQ